MKAVLGQITNSQLARKCDSAGCGHYGASRKRIVNGISVSIPGAHKGVDFVTTLGQQINSPISGKVILIGQAYSDDKRYKTIHIQGEGNCYLGIKAKILYVDSKVSVGSTVTRGQIIGTAQDLTLKYKGITNHIHVEVYENGVIQNPTNLFGSSDCNDVSNQDIVLGVRENSQGNDQDTYSTVFVTVDNSSIEDLLKLDEFKENNISKEDLLNVEVDGKTNHRRIYEGLTNVDKRKYNNGDLAYSESADYFISGGTEIFLPIAKITIQRSYESNITITKTKINEYFPPLINAITNDPGYVEAKNQRGNIQQHIYPQLTIKVWSRTRYLESGGLSGFIDITKYVNKCSTQSSIGDGGNFSFEVGPIVARLLAESTSDNSEEDNDVWTSTGSAGEGVDVGNVHRERVFKYDGDYASEFTRSNFLHDKIIQGNDLVFISFEKLEIDGEEDGSLSGKWYDMIGLVDSVGTSVSGANTDVSTTIRGRDLIKVLQDDNSYFNLRNIGHASSSYGGEFGDRYLQGSFQETSAIIPRSIRQ
jgi:hypothetical protein